ncbi:MAG: hypothetical protein ACREAF_03405 [Nitrosopumilaceae archaeon]
MQKARPKKNDTELTPEIEELLDRIDSGKEKTTTYANAKEYLKHVDEVLEE